MMGLLARLFSLGRLGAPSQGERGGPLLSGTKRAQLDLKEYHAPTGCVQIIDGTWRCVAKVTGYPLHARSEQDALSFITAICAVLNRLPGRLVLLSRSYPGGLEDYIASRVARAVHSDGPMRRLLEDQSRHALARVEQGRYRKSAQFLCTQGKTAEEARSLMTDTIGLLAAAHTQAQIVKSEALAEHIARSWRPEMVEHFVIDFSGPDGEVLASLAYSPSHAKATRPRYLSLPTTQRKALVG